MLSGAWQMAIEAFGPLYHEGAGMRGLVFFSQTFGDNNIDDGVIGHLPKSCHAGEDFQCELSLTWDDVQSKYLWVPRISFVSGATNPATLVQFNCSVTQSSDSLGDPTIRWSAVHARHFNGDNYLPSDASFKKTSSRLLGAAFPTSRLSRSWTSLRRRTTSRTPASSPNKLAKVIPALYHENAKMIGNIAQYPPIIALIKSVQELSERIHALEGVHWVL